MQLTDLLLDIIFPPTDSEIYIRTITYDVLAQTLSPVLRGENTQPVVSLFPYESALAQACILEAKFKGDERAAQMLGYALYEFLSESLAEDAPFTPSIPILVPLPLSRERLQERGYNQTERVARAAFEVGLAVGIDTELLFRARATKPQTSLSGRVRQQNVAGAFSVSRECDPNRTYIVLDDVITTGHTMYAACDALRAGGALRLLPVTVAY